MSETGTVEQIHIADINGGPVRGVGSVSAVAGSGLAGDRNHRQPGDDSRGRDLTLVEAENIEALARDHGIRLAPGETRRNITTRGVRLNDLVGKEFWIGDVRARAVRLCEPCDYLQGLVGKPILKPLAHRAGIRADLLTSGTISVGDVIREEA
ncbi:MAG TPA: MOSC domain-containing protein [Candidatus Dormibacteraeota bacterium]|nr:MOSC domain-containing protein [Candidatus Dormibacteraeota bacterium]